MHDLSKEIDFILSKAGGTWGIYVKDLASGAVILEVNPTRPFPAVSTAKLAIALYAFSEADKGSLSLSERLELKKEFVLTGSGVLKYLDDGLQPTILDLISLMLVVSDNTCAKMLVGKLTPQKINEYVKFLGLKTTRLEVNGNKFYFGLTTPKELSDLLEGIYKHSFLSAASSEKLLEILKRSDDDNRIRRYLAEPGIANKTGSAPGVRHDVGIVFAKSPYTICILSEDLTDQTNSVDNKGVLAIAEISKIIYDSIVG